MKKHRSAITGQYVKAGYAKANPKNTVSETDKPKPKPPGGGKGKGKK